MEIQEYTAGRSTNNDSKNYGDGAEEKDRPGTPPNKKDDLLEWTRFNRDRLAEHELYATGTTGNLLARELDLGINRLRSGPLGGDQQIGSKIVEGETDFLVFFWDLLEAQPHDPDVKALLRLAVVWNISIACDRASADFLFSLSLMSEEYERILPDYEDYMAQRVIEF